MTRRICLVTDELYPMTAGGIGRLTYNILRGAIDAEAPVELHVVAPGYAKFEHARFQAVFGGKVALHTAAIRTGAERGVDEAGHYPPASAFRGASWHLESLDIMRKLGELESEGLVFDVIEFPDFRGLAFCTLMEKRLGLRFQQTEIAVRLHTTHGVLMHVEALAPELENLSRFELERKALRDADVVIAHLPQIAEFNQAYYGFPKEWLERVRVEFPPVVEGLSEGRLASPQREHRDLAFITKLQPCKGPETFVRAAALLMERRPAYRGRAQLSCHAFDPAYEQSIIDLVPEALKERFLFTPPGAGREELMRRSIVVIPSHYESLNLTAYEAAAAGAVLVLNGACPAFADPSPFLDGINSFKSDGTVEGLSRAMERALDEALPEPVRWQAQSPYWTQPAEAHKRPATELEPSIPEVSVVVVHRDQPWKLGVTLESLAAAEDVRLELVLVDDASESSIAREVLEEVDGRDGTDGVRLKIVRSPIRLGRAASVNRGVAKSRAPVVCLLEAGDVVTPEFLGVAARALVRNPEFDVVTPTLGDYQSEAQLLQRQCRRYSVFMGDAPSTGLVVNRIAGRILVARRTVLEAAPFNEQLERSDHWAAVLNWAHRGHRFLVTNQVHGYQPMNREPEVSSIFDGRERMTDVTPLWEQIPRTEQAGWRLFAPVTGALACSSGMQDAWDDDGLSAPVRYETVELLVRGLTHAASLVPVPLRASFQLKRDGEEAQARSGNELLPAWAAEQRSALYDVVDAVNNAVKVIPGLHGGLKAVTRSVLRTAAGRTPRLPR